MRDNIIRCPFCNSPIEEPREIASRFGDIISGGKCGCGAVYVYDRSGHNLGDAYVDGLNLACNGDMDKAWSLMPGEDYEIIESSYDARRNRLGRTSASRGKLSPTYLFLRLKNREKD
ncbi:MAG: hypothetical protein AB1632_10505 [Nitrospirota bacterium]